MMSNTVAEEKVFDASTASREEIQNEIDRLKLIANDLKNEEQAYKLLSNSQYGALANKWMIAFNSDIAETVTLQGQDIIKYAEKCVNKYFNEYWHKDKDLHDKIGLKGTVKRVTRPVNIYSDTDSCYITFEEVIASCEWNSDPKKLILLINEHRLSSYLNACFGKYAKERKTENYLDFELENVSEAGIWLAKKKYLTNVVWESGIDIESKTQIVYKGVELVQSSTPPFVRDKLKMLVNHIFTKKKNLELVELVRLMKEFKAEFKLADPEVISMSRSVNDYSYIVNDSTAFEVEKGCPIHVRAAGYYNYLLNSKEKAYKNKYQMARVSDKIKYYYVKTHRESEQDVFGFLSGSYPYEFAPPVDYDTQFAKTVIDPINRIIESMGYQSVSPQLFVANTLF